MSPANQASSGTLTVITDRVWQSADLNRRFLEGVRGGIPLAEEQLRILRRLVNGVGFPVRAVLDLGCGDGVLGRALLAEHPDATGVFLDFSETMLAAARNALGSDLSRHRTVAADFGASDWVAAVEADAPFDVIVSGFSIHHQSDDRKRALYGELFGLLRPGGIFLNLEHVASASTWGEAMFDAYFVEALVDYHQRKGSCRTPGQIADEYYHREDKAANCLAAVEVQCAWLRDVGFERVDCFFKAFELALFGGLRPGT